jgi:hypothetical protein
MSEIRTRPQRRFAVALREPDGGVWIEFRYAYNHEDARQRARDQHRFCRVMAVEHDRGDEPGVSSGRRRVVIGR